MNLSKYHKSITDSEAAAVLTEALNEEIDHREITNRSCGNESSDLK